MIESDFVIVGGGVAGLCAAIRLTELGAKPLVIEAGDYPSHKVCGEFLSPVCIEILKKWDIFPIEVPYACFHTSNDSLKFRFPNPAGSLSHLQLDPLLMHKAQKGGAIIKTHTKVEHLDHANRKLKLDSGEWITASNLILATGRLPQYNQKCPSMRYMGIKAHFEGFSNLDSLEMFLFKDAYAGISPIEEGKFNVAILIDLNKVKHYGNSEQIMDQLLRENKKFRDYFAQGKRLFPEWMHTLVPAFGIKSTPHWSHSYFIGDGAATIPPASGNGLTMAIIGGILSAEYAIQRDVEGFRKAWHQYCRTPIQWGHLLHHLLTKPLLSNSFIKLSKPFPFLSKAIYNLGRV